MRALLFGLALGLASGSAIAAELDGPIGGATMESEMRRGAAIALNCELLPTAAARMQCVLSAAAAEEQRRANVDAFELGLYFAACHAELDASRSAAISSSPQSEVTEKGNIATLYQFFITNQKKLGATDVQVVSAVPDRTEDWRQAALEQLRMWEAGPPQP